jgi:hypothetical protein
MKIETAYSPNRTPSRRTGRANGSDFARALDAQRGIAPPQAARAAADASVLLAAQEVGQDEVERRRGHAVLDRLEELRHGLLAGALSRRSLERLTALVATERAHAVDPRLASVLDEIELRAKVELAKHMS